MNLTREWLNAVDLPSDSAVVACLMDLGLSTAWKGQINFWGSEYNLKGETYLGTNGEVLKNFENSNGARLVVEFPEATKMLLENPELELDALDYSVAELVR